ncbi:MAG: hypothetical protein JEZ12_09205 [Desulfobacterium sp.]|nr:hypothetical protein [Desulfobacterium sp.]
MKNNTNGFILVGMVIMMLIIALTAMTMNRRAGMGDRMSANHVLAVRTQFGGDAAIQYALWKLKNDPDFRTPPGGEPFSFDGLGYTLTVETSPLGGYEDVVRISAGPSGGTATHTLGVRIAQPPSFTGVYLCDTGNACVREIDPATGLITTLAGQGGTSGFAGDNGPADQALLSKAVGVTGDLAGNIVIADTENNCIRKVDTTGIITTIAGIPGIVGGYSGDNGPALAAKLNAPEAIDFDQQGNIFIADTANDCIRRIDAATGIITTVAGIGTSSDYTGDGGPATAAEMKKPEGIAVDAMGNLFISDTGNHVIRRMNGVTGIITTIAGTGKSGFYGEGIPALIAKLNTPGSITEDDQNNLFIADTGNHIIRKIDAVTGIIATVAGLPKGKGYTGDNIPVTLARLNAPEGALGMANGDIYIADTANNRIRRVDGATGLIFTIAGNGSSGFSGDDGPAVNALLNAPMGIHHAPQGSGAPIITRVSEIY